MLRRSWPRFPCTSTRTARLTDAPPQGRGGIRNLRAGWTPLRAAWPGQCTPRSCSRTAQACKLRGASKGRRRVATTALATF
jgi:hypothetical protein